MEIDIEKIAVALNDNYPDEDVEELKLNILREMILSLHDYEDYDQGLDKYKLQLIHEAWMELVN